MNTVNAKALASLDGHESFCKFKPVIQAGLITTMLQDLTSPTPGANSNSSGDRTPKIAALWLPPTIAEVSPGVERDFQIKRIGVDTEFGAFNVLASDSEKDIRLLLRRAKQAGKECKIYEMPGGDFGQIILRYADIHDRLLIESKYEEDWERTNQSKALSLKDFKELAEDIFRDCYEIGWDKFAATIEADSLIPRTGKSEYAMRKDYLEPIRQELERLYKKTSTVSSGKKSLLLERYQAAKEALGERLRWNELKMAPELDGKPLDFDIIQIQLAEETGLDFPEAHVRSTILRLAYEHSYDPVKDYLEQAYSAHKDDVLPLDTLAEVLLGVKNRLYNTYLVKHLIGSVARRFKPGCQMDTMLVLKGKQGIKKSTFFRTLYGNDWFDSTPADMGNGKDELLRQHTHWCNELGELDGITSRKDAARMKAELTNPKDTFRPPYGRNTKEYPRRFVSVGTTNSDSFLVDPTGDRRFWVIDLGSKVIDLDKVRSLKDKIWATAVSAYKAGMEWWLTSEEQEESNLANKGYAVADTWEDFILAFLAQELAKGVTFTTVSICLADSLLKIEPTKQSKVDQNRCADILRRSGWTKGQKKVGGRPLKVWLPPTPEEVSTPPGGYQGVDTAEMSSQQRIEPLQGEVSTPKEEKLFDDEISSKKEGELKNIEVGVDTSAEIAANPLPDCNSVVSTPLVSTPDVDTSPVATESQALAVDDMVFWSECPAHCSNFAPFQITSIDGDHARLDLIEKPVPLTELSRA
jgi:predicted P-loop ATPase